MLRFRRLLVRLRVLVSYELSSDGASIHSFLSHASFFSFGRLLEGNSCQVGRGGAVLHVLQFNRDLELCISYDTRKTSKVH